MGSTLFSFSYAILAAYEKWLEYTERMSYVLSQGKHICDIALVYPTDALQAYPDKNPDRVFDLALRLSNKGLDYDFVDYHSLRKAISDGKHLSISGNQYKILILADMKAVHYTTLLAARDFIVQEELYWLPMTCRLLLLIEEKGIKRLMLFYKNYLA